MRKSQILSAIALLMLLFGCTGPAAPGNASANNTAGWANNSTTGIPNPASEFCAKHNGTLDIRNDENGQYGACVFASGAICEEWAYYRGECSPERPNYCKSDDSCACGVHAQTRECFYGQGEFVDESQQCPDYCNGIAAHLEIVCLNHQCTQRMRDRCLDFGVDECPAGCSVCPPCPECSSIKCQKEEACEAAGFGKGWYNSTVQK